MRTTLFVAIVFTLMFLGCNDEKSITESPIVENAKGVKVSLSGEVNTSFNAEVAMLNTGSEVVITIVGEGEFARSLLLSSNQTKTGTYSIPDGYEVSFNDPSTNKIYELITGSVKIASISNTSVSGSLIGSGFGLDLTTFQIDSTKILNVSVSF